MTRLEHTLKKSYLYFVAHCY